jgi:peptide/nickel transport system permease protein
VGTMLFANIGFSTPVFVLGLLLAFIFAIVLKGTPFALPPSGRLSSGVEVIPLVEVWGLQGVEGLPRAFLDFVSGIYTLTTLITLQTDAFVDAFRHLILPAIALGTIPLAIIARITRSSLLDVLGLDYVRTARAKGLDDRTVLLRHAFKNAVLPVVTIIGLQVGLLLSGAVLTESIFNLAGVGKTMFDAIEARDYVVIQGFTLMIAIIFLVVNLIVDVSYAYLDPRVKVS